MKTSRNRMVLLAVALSLTLVACALPAQAESLYRCVSPQGRASYQQIPRCPPGQRLDRAIAYRPEPDSPHATAVFKPARPAYVARTTGSRKTTGRGKRQVTASERCRIAKEQRARATRKLGLKRTYDDLGRLDAPVREACRW